MRASSTIAVGSLLVLGGSPVALGAPSLSDGTLSPTSWSSATTAAVTWTQNDFGGGLPGPALVQVNAADDGSDAGEWENRATISGPLASGSNGVISLPVSAYEGRHRVRVVVPGAAGSPLELGTLHLDRAAPAATDAHATVVDGRISISWAHSDAGSGLDPGSPPRAEVNADPSGGGGLWQATDSQARGGGRFHATAPLTHFEEGTHRVRVRAIDNAGNESVVDVGSVLVDTTAPRFSDVRIVRAPEHDDRTVRVAYRVADPGPSGLDGPAGVRLGPPRGADELTYASTGAAQGSGEITARLGWAGPHRLSLRATDRAGNVGESVAFTVQVPPTPGVPVSALDGHVRERAVRLPPPRGALTAPDAVRRAYSAARLFHRRRGVPVTARLGTARTHRHWKRLLGTKRAPRFVGFASFRGHVLLGPLVVEGLESLDDARPRARRAPTRREADSMVTAMAVLLHETLHASGPQAVHDYRRFPSGRAFEEGFTQAATLDLLRPFVRSLRLRPPLRRPLLAAVRRYRGPYVRQVGWARRLSAEVTGGSAGSRAARAWRLRVADRWGTDRWERLAALTGRDPLALRRSAPDPDGGRRLA